ncbi:MAG: prolipoprotein diacylglyceryl transferase [Chromatiales bacterium]|jgi:phosphatidylglycerol:prolipoprotein diacylglycerol transferase
MLTYPDIDPVALQLGPLKVHWYGLSYMLGFVAGWLLARWRAKQSNGLWTMKMTDDLLFYAVLGVVLGGRIGYILFYDFSHVLNDPLLLFKVWQGGMSFHGGLLGVLLAMLLFARRMQMRFFTVTDFIAPLVPLGLLTGRLGNFINGELWGAPSDVPWAMQVSCSRFYYLCSDKLQLPPGTRMTPPLHPSQLYEALLEGVLLFVMLWLYSSRQPPRMAVSGAFLFGYGLFRSAVEFVRMPDAHIGYLFGDWLTMGHVLSLPMLLAGAALLYFAYQQKSGKRLT